MENEQFIAALTIIFNELKEIEVLTQSKLDDMVTSIKSIRATVMRMEGIITILSFINIILWIMYVLGHK